MTRRRFIVGVTLSLCGEAVVADAQTKPTRITLLGPSEEPRFSEIAEGLKQGLRDHGYVSSALELIEAKVARGDLTAARAMTSQSLDRGVALLFVIGSELARTARQVSSDIPIVFVTPGDPVQAGLVASLARPGGNTTAMTFEFPELSAKRLELLKELVPGMETVLVLHDPADASPRQGMDAARAAVSKLGIGLIDRELRNASDLGSALEALGKVHGLLAIPGGRISAHYAEIIEAANVKRVPTVVQARTAGAGDALASYGASDTGVARESARLVDRILKGEKAGNLPVERPTKFELVINLKVAHLIGLKIPAQLLARADHVIE
jgi:putative ABC transport system substrate-binding protein